MLEKFSFFLQWKYLIIMNLVLIAFLTRQFSGTLDRIDDFYEIKEIKQRDLAQMIHRYIERSAEFEIMKERDDFPKYSGNQQYLDSLLNEIKKDQKAQNVRLIEMYQNPEFISWTFTFGMLALIANTVFMFYKYLIEKFMEWKKDDDFPLRLFLKSIFIENWWVYLFCY